MKRTISLILAICIFTMVFMTGCSGNPKSLTGTHEPLNLSIVIGAHRFFPKISGGIAELYDRIFEACISYGSVSSVVVDGEPSTRSNYTVIKPGKDLTKSKEETIARQNTSTILQECACAKAKVPEVDTLEAIKVSANLLNASEGGNKLMYVYDNGLCTAGTISQLNGDFLSTDHEMLVEKLNAMHSLPDLSGITVEWLGLGCTVGDQSCIPDSYKYKLEEMWRTIITAAGGQVEFNPTPISGEEISGLPDVTQVSFANDILKAESISQDTFAEPVAFDESTIKFVSDKAEFIDRKAALDALMPVAELLKDNHDLSIMIAGTTASIGSFENCIILSRERAEACRDVLIEYGAEASQIECIGLGRSDNCFRVDDLNADGSLNEKMAKLNRAIYIFASDSEIAKNIAMIDQNKEE